MTASSHPQEPQYSGTYFVQDRHNEEELLRVADQDRLVTTSMGGVLAEQTDPSLFRRVLDVACGPGGWLIETAQAYPWMSLVGIDINQHMLDYARAQASAHHLDERLEFHAMDALRVLDFPDASFDLVNMRFAMSFLRTWDWQRLLHNLLRIVRPGGVVRVTDEEIIHQSTSSASVRFCEMLLSALFQSGHLFTQESTGLTAHLTSLFDQHGYKQVQTQSYALHYQAGTPECQRYVEDGMRVLQTLRPFLQKWGYVNKDYDALCQQAFEETHRPDFSATWRLLTVWGCAPELEAYIEYPFL